MCQLNRFSGWTFRDHFSGMTLGTCFLDRLSRSASRNTLLGLAIENDIQSVVASSTSTEIFKIYQARSIEPRTYWNSLPQARLIKHRRGSQELTLSSLVDPAKCSINWGGSSSFFNFWKSSKTPPFSQWWGQKFSL